MAVLSRWLPGDELTLYDEFSGAGGSTQGAAAVPGVRPVFAANHDEVAIASHAANFPGVEPPSTSQTRPLLLRHDG